MDNNLDRVFPYGHVWPNGMVLPDLSVDAYNQFTREAVAASNAVTREFLLEQRQRFIDSAIQDYDRGLLPVLPSIKFADYYDSEFIQEIANGFASQQDEFFRHEAAFGAAGGPQRLTLSDDGLVYAYNAAAQGYFQFNIEHIQTLQFVASVGEFGHPLPFSGVLHKFHDPYFRLSMAQAVDSSQALLAHSLSGRENHYAILHDAVHLLKVRRSLDSSERVVLTTLGRRLLVGARKMGDAMLEARNRAENVLTGQQKFKP